MARDTYEIQADIMYSRERLRDIAEAIGWKADVPSRVRDIAREASATLRSRNPGASHDGPGASERLHHAGDAVTGAAGSAKDAVADTLSSARDAVAGGLSSAKETVSSGLSNARDAVTDGAAGAQEGIGSGAGRVRETGAGVAERLPSRDALAEDARGLVRTARENPLPLAIGGLVIGAAAAALLPSSRAERERVGPVADRVVDRGADLAQDAMETGHEAVRERVGVNGADEA